MHVGAPVGKLPIKKLHNTALSPLEMPHYKKDTCLTQNTSRTSSRGKLSAFMWFFYIEPHKTLSNDF
ncbi:hypothetical protein APHNP_1528 [Anaplasma phagocytophilum str. ApNP]|uniref:Uncharacterized protein n=2 Tax=Anaplasma phagocytophilum TaxID=948 RepID=A0A0F3NEN4_ANAPH|nr:hypothetical protein APHMUC_1667 [Anaplasma phagocytophilum str. ApMUC09]KJV66505.1 hypothetical protein APHNP_1528 [Anaplasma phagocytophilum str. ApNP]